MKFGMSDIKEKSIHERHATGKKYVVQNKNGYTKVIETPITKPILIACYAVGYLGIHRFMQRQIGMGILYFFTLGIFSVGWIVDMCKYTYRYFSKSDKGEVYLDYQSLQKIISESERIAKKTSNPETFFYRYSLYLENLKTLYNAEKDGYQLEDMSMIPKLNELTDTDVQIKTINDFIDRYWQYIKSEGVKAKTESGEHKLCKRFFEVMQRYDAVMPQQSKDYYMSKLPPK